MEGKDIEIDEELLELAMRRHGLQTKSEAIDLALRALAGQPLSDEGALAMGSARLIDDVPPDQGPG